MGGGSKKKSFASAEKAQSRVKGKEGEAKEEKKSTEQKTGPRSVVVGEELLKTIRKEAAKTSAITPFSVASKYNLKISTAKDLLKGLATANVIRKATSNRRTIVYVPVQVRPEETPAA